MRSPVEDLENAAGEARSHLWRFVVLAFLLSVVRAPALEWHQAEGYRWADLLVPKNGKPGFTQVPAA